MNRRQFLETTLATAGGVLAAGVPVLGQWGQGTARIVVARDTRMPGYGQNALAATLRSLTHMAVRDVTGQGDPTRAWASLFTKDDIVGVKLNTIAPEIAPHPAIIGAIAEGLTSVGIPPEHIIVFDKEDRDLAAAGYQINLGGPGVQTYGTVGGENNPGYEDRFTTRGETTFRLSKIVTRQVTAVVNVPVIKHHAYAGMTCGLKNHFGCIHNPEDFHNPQNRDGIVDCKTAIPAVNTHRAIKDKQRLIVCDAVRVQYDNGPAFSAADIMQYSAVIAATDPVALDTQIALLVDMCRQMQGLPRLADTERPPAYIQNAASAGLGTNNTSAIQVISYDLANG